MHPNLFLQTLWRPERKRQVFVAMSFDRKHMARYEKVIRPAIEKEPFGDLSLKAYRVDNSKSGDSILTEIADGIAHSYLVLADASVIDEGCRTRRSFRNGNVMYEVGLALACRPPSDVLLIRDDDKPFLFDVSTIPHLTLDFDDTSIAQKALRSAIYDRIRESSLIRDARVEIAVSQLADDEFRLLKIFSHLEPNQGVDLRLSVANTKILSNPDARGIDGLLRKRLIEVFGATADDSLVYRTTEFGYAVAQLAAEKIQIYGHEENAEPDASKET
jgi:hypothetical protein